MREHDWAAVARHGVNAELAHQLHAEFSVHELQVVRALQYESVLGRQSADAQIQYALSEGTHAVPLDAPFTVPL